MAQQQVDGAVPIHPLVEPIVNPDGNPNHNINAVKIRVPPFWKNDPELWFLQIEAQFSICNITNDNTKFNTVIGNVDANFLDSVKDIIRNPPANNRYETIKQRLTATFQESDNNKIKTLLNELTLGDLKPSDSLHKMQNLSCGKVGNDLLQILWLQRLPLNIQSVLACSTDPLNTLATMADKIFEATCNTSIQGITQPSKTNSDLADLIYNIEDKINALNKKFDMSKPRTKSQSPQRSRNNNSANNICWYHNNHGKNAYKCIPPCNFAQQNSKKSYQQTNPNKHSKNE